MAEKVFYEVISGGNKIPVRDLAAHERLDGIDTTLEGHIGDGTHLSAGERDKWNNATSSIQSHSGNADIHVTTADKQNWNGKVNSTDFETYKTSVHDEFVNVSSFVNTELAKKVDNTALQEYQQTVAGDFADLYGWASGNFDEKLDKTIYDAYTAANDAEVGKKLYISSFNTYTADAAVLFETKLNKSTYESFTAAADVKYYSAGPNINIDNHVISGKNWQTEIDNAKAWASAELDKKVSTATTADWDVTEYSAGDGIGITDHVISVTSDFITLEELASSGYATKDYVDEAFDELADAIDEKFNTTLVAGRNITITSAEGATSADIEYTVAMKDPDDVLNWARFNSNGIAYTTGTTATLAFTSAEGAGTNITLNGNNQVVLDKGSYHVDIQVIAGISGGDNAYYDAGLSAGSNRVVMQSVDGSYAHTETLDLSFDIRVQNNGSVLNFELAGLPPCTYQVKNLNIHEFLTLEAAQEAAGGVYNAGVGLTLDSTTHTFDVNLGDGLELKDGTNNIQVKLGEGLTFTDDHGIKAIAIDPEGEVQQVVDTVQKMETDLDTKVTTNFQPAQITTSADYHTAGEVNNGELLGYLFTVPINNKIYMADDATAKYTTCIGVYSTQSYTQSYIMLGLYEYDPNYQHKDSQGAVTAWGRTVPLCDTGRVKLSAGFNEFPIVHNNALGETSDELKSNCMYYASIYLPPEAGNGIFLACCPNYNVAFNAVPQITTNQTNIPVRLDGADADSASFNDMGFGSWASTAQNPHNFHEYPTSPRLWMQIRNKLKATN